MALDAATRRLVRQRADNRCEYCKCHQDLLLLITFHVEHIIEKQHGGIDDDSSRRSVTATLRFARHRGRTLVRTTFIHVNYLCKPAHENLLRKTKSQSFALQMFSGAWYLGQYLAEPQRQRSLKSSDLE